MRTSQVFGGMLLVGGAILLFFGYQASQSMGEQLVEGLTGRFTDETTWFFLIGGVAAAGGLLLLVLRR